jgi:hypothetical protein
MLRIKVFNSTRIKRINETNEKPEERTTFLQTDIEDSIVEITRWSIFPNLKIFNWV